MPRAILLLLSTMSKSPATGRRLAVRRYHHKPWRAVRTEAMEALLSELGVVDSNRVDEIVSYYEEGIGPKSGARVVAKAWTDPAFKARLLADGLEAG
jgi:hypothetical protein